LTAKHEYNFTANLKRTPDIPKIIHEIQQEWKIPRSHFICDAVQDRYKTEKQKRYQTTIDQHTTIFDDGKHQTQLDVELPSILCLDEWFKPETQGKLRKMEADDIIKLEKKAYVVLDIIKRHKHLRGIGHYNDTLEIVRQKIVESGDIEELLRSPTPTIPSPPPPSPSPQPTTTAEAAASEKV
jgi:hypothetical protein